MRGNQCVLLMKVHATAILVTLAGWLRTSTAQAFEEQWHVGGGVGAVSASASQLGLGPSVNVYGAYGLDDMFDVKLDFAASNHAFEATPDATDRRSTYTGTLGITYKIDVIEWIPYFGAHVGWLYTNLPQDLGMATGGFLVGGVIGLDYSVSDSWGVGVANQLHIPLDGGTLVGLFLRAEYHWSL